MECAGPRRLSRGAARVGGLGSGPSQVGAVYEVPFWMTTPVEVAAVACAADGISSVVVRGSFYPLAAWTCVQDQVVAIEFERSVQVFFPLPCLPLPQCHHAAGGLSASLR